MKAVTVRMEEELYKALRIKAITIGKSVTDYFNDLVKEDLKKE